jgi:hypothetical protein
MTIREIAARRCMSPKIDLPRSAPDQMLRVTQDSAVRGHLSDAVEPRAGVESIPSTCPAAGAPGGEGTTLSGASNLGGTHIEQH